MPVDPSSSGKSGWLPSKDISSILQGWDYEPGTINVRKIIGSNGAPKLQMRLDLGLLQMETDGRPDGQRPHGCESLLEFHEDRLKDHRERNGTELGFHLTPAQCQNLRDETLMYHNRYLSLFVLGEYAGVARDTARNLRVLDLCGKYAIDDHDRLVLEQYRPYIVMMYTRATAAIEVETENYAEAMLIVKNGLREIKRFFIRFDQVDAYRKANEVRILKKLAAEIRVHLPPDPVRQLKKDLQRALKDERYEEAARLRDEIERLEAKL